MGRGGGGVRKTHKQNENRVRIKLWQRDLFKSHEFQNKDSLVAKNHI